MKNEARSMNEKFPDWTQKHSFILPLFEHVLECVCAQSDSDIILMHYTMKAIRWLGQVNQVDWAGP